MNDSVLTELKAVVERAVRPVRATIAQKRRMREELLSHLVSIFEEEAKSLGDEQRARERTRERFGDPRELSKQLQESVPRWDRCRSIMERLGYQRDESVWHLAAKHLLVTLLIYAVAVLIWLPIMVALQPVISTVPGRHSDLQIILPIVIVAALTSAALSLLLSPLPNKIGQFLHGGRLGRYSFFVLCALVSFLIFPLAPAASAIFLLMTRQATEGWRYQEDRA
jgi:hypothetical protein